MRNFSDRLITKRILFLGIALLFFSLGITSLVAAPPALRVAPQANEASSGNSDFPAIVAKSSPFDHAAAQVSPESLMILLMQMGFLYGGFICVLLAFEIGFDKPAKNRPAKVS